jgi:hypothetical protein
MDVLIGKFNAKSGVTMTHGFHSNSTKTIGVTVLVAAELRHAGGSLWHHFSDCGTLWDIIERLWALDEATFLGVVAFAAIIAILVTGHLVRALSHFKKTRIRKLNTESHPG